MNVTVRCPSCGQSASVAKAGAFDRSVMCSGCLAVYEPTAATPEPPEPPPAKIRGFGPRPAEGPARRSRPPQPPEARPVTPPAPPTRPARKFAPVTIGLAALFGLVAIGGGGWIVLRVVSDGAWRRHAIPDAPEIEVEFPGPAAAATEYIEHVGRGAKTEDRTPVPVFKCERPGGEVYAVLVRTVPWHQLRAADGHVRRQEYNMELPSVVRGGNWKDYQHRTVTVGGYEADECFVPAAARGRSFVFRTVLIDNLTCTLFVAGPGITADLPRVQRFFDSFRHTRFPPELVNPAPSAPDPSAMRLLGRVAPHAAAFFAPRHNAVFVVGDGKEWKPLDTHPETGKPVKPLKVVPDGVPGPAPHIARYHYPSFRLEAVVPIDDPFTAIRIDEGAGLLCGPSVWFSGSSRTVGYVQHALPPANSAPPDWKQPSEPRKRHVDAVPEAATPHVLSPDGRRLYAVASPDGPAATVRGIDLDTRRTVGNLPVPGARAGLAISPDGARLYALTPGDRPPPHPSDIVPTPDILHEIDTATLTSVGRTRLRSQVAGVIPLNDRRLIGFGAIERTLNLLRGFPRSALIDLNVNPPREWLVGVGDNYISRYAVRGDRVYVSCGEIQAWDVSEAANGRVRRLASAKFATGLCVSPDGKYMVVPDGRVYWLGDGPLPPIDPGASWGE